MPLHLLGKKSWNVYNSANIERVRRDEAEAKAKEEADEQRMQEEDAQRRIALLRGEVPPELTSADGEEEGSRVRHKEHERKRKRRRGEDDTERDIRYAAENGGTAARARHFLLREEDKTAPLYDHAGNIQLIPAPDEATIRKAEKNAEAEAEKAKRQKKAEDQYTMRFSNATGYAEGTAKPWYTSNNMASSAATHQSDLTMLDVQSKDVWGNEDPLRKERERNRISSADPLAAMKQAQRQLKQSGREREAWKTKQRAELEDMEAALRRRRKHRKQDDSHHREQRDSFDGFSLDAYAGAQPEPSDDGRQRRKNNQRQHRNEGG